MEVRQIQVFQTDSLLIKNHLISNSNYIIEYNESVKEEYCVVYFSSNDLYYPNTEISFKETVISKNRYEWYGNRINYAHKHIFIRDIQKQWYLGGINHQINTTDNLQAYSMMMTTTTTKCKKLKANPTKPVKTAKTAKTSKTAKVKINK